MLFRDAGEPYAMLCKQGLVRRYDGFPGDKSGRYGAFGGIIFPADQFNKDIDLAVGSERDGIGEPTKSPDIDIALLAPRASAHCNYLDRAPASAGERRTLAIDKPDHRGA